MWHGHNYLSKAIELLDETNRDDFNYFVNTECSFNPENMFICKSKEIINDYYKSIFSWLGRFLEKARTVMLNLGTALILIFFGITIIGALTSFGPEIKDPSGRVLLIDPQETVVDEEVFKYDILINLGTNFSTDQIQTRDLIQLIRAAADDEDIPAVFIDFSSTDFAGPTTAINIAKELKALRDSGKRIIAFNDRLSTSSYLMASQASEVWVHPVGSISVKGLGGCLLYTSPSPRDGLLSRMPSSA